MKEENQTANQPAPQKKKKNKKLGNLLLLVVAFLWGSSLTVVKGAQD